MKANYIVCYDICDSGRLAKIYKHMKERGIHLQYSVFHCRLTWPELIELKEVLREMIDEKKDDVRIYPLPQQMKTIVLGCGDRVPEGVDIFLQ